VDGAEAAGGVSAGFARRAPGAVPGCRPAPLGDDDACLARDVADLPRVPHRRYPRREGAMAVSDRALAELIDPRTREGTLWEPLTGGRLRCLACGHRCVIPPGQRGVCKVRYNADGRLRVPWGYVAGLQLDPIEKKPFFHAYPGARALSFGMLGCDF